MSDEISVGGKLYISSKRASDFSGYTQDYIGQLARGGSIDARRIGGLWYVAPDSLEAYKKKADETAPEEPSVRVHEGREEPESLIFFDGKDYVSAARAARITGYHQDYVGQLARSGKVLSRQVGNRWYVEREGILAHKAEKDGLLGAVQAESVGVMRGGKGVVGDGASENDTHFRYHSEEGSAIPKLMVKVEKPEEGREGEKEGEEFLEPDVSKDRVAQYESTRVPIKVVTGILPVRREAYYYLAPTVRASEKSSVAGKYALFALGIVFTISLGYLGVEGAFSYAMSGRTSDQNSYQAASAAYVATSLSRISEFLEVQLAPEISYRHPGH